MYRPGGGDGVGVGKDEVSDHTKSKPFKAFLNSTGEAMESKDSEAKSEVEA